MFFSDKKNAATFHEFALEPGYELIMLTVCFYLIRYVIASLLIEKGKKNTNNVLLILDKMGDNLHDSFVEFIKNIERNFDFDKALNDIEEIKKICESDYFLKNYLKEIVEGARELTVRSYAKIYNVLDLEKMAKFSGLPVEKVVEIAQTEIKENGLIGTLSADKKIITVTLKEFNMNRKIAEKGHELEERTKKFVEAFKSN